MNSKKLRETVEETAHNAAEVGAHALEEAKAKISPLVGQAADFVGPKAHEAKVRGAELASHTREAIQPRIDEAIRFVGPHVDAAKEQAEVARERVAPYVDAAKERVTPAVEAAKDFADDLLPKLAAALHEAAEHPLAKETTRRLSAATAALVGDLEPVEKLVPKKKSGVGKTIAKVAVAAALIAGVVYAVKRFFGPRDEDWQTHESSLAYVPPTDLDTKLADAEADMAAQESQAQQEADLAQANAADDAIAEETVSDPVVTADDGAADDDDRPEAMTEDDGEDDAPARAE